MKNYTELLKHSDWTITKRLQLELEAAKYYLKLHDASMIIIEAFKHSEQYVFKSKFRDEYYNLFGESFFVFGGMRTTYRNIKHYNDLHKICYGILPENTKELTKAFRLFSNCADERAWQIMYKLSDLHFEPIKF